MNLFLAVVQFLLISAVLVKEVKRKSPGMFLWATLFLMFGFTHLFDVVAGAGEYGAGVMTGASLFVTLFCLVYVMTRAALCHRFPLRLQDTFFNISSGIGRSEKHTGLLFLLLIVASLMMTGSIIVRSGGIGNTSWGNTRELSVQQSYLSGGQIWTILYFAMGGLLCCSLISKSRAGTAVAVVCMAFVELVTRNRVLVLPLVVSIIAYFIFRIRKIRLSTVFLAAAGGVAVIYLVYAIRAFRWMGELSSALQEFDLGALNDQIKTFLVTSDGELGLRKWMYYFMENNNQFENFGRGHTYMRMLFVYIPTKLSLGLKPPDFALSMGSAIGMAQGGSMHPTLFGDCYANFGAAGVLLGGLWAAVIHINDRIIDRMRYHQIKVLLFVLLSTAYIIIGRGAVYNGFVNIAWCVPLLVVISRLKLEIPRIKFSHRKFVRYGKEQV